MADQAIRVDGLSELFRAFGQADKALRSDLRDAVAEAASPVRSEAQSLAASQIRNVAPGDPWSMMRIGVAGNTAYVAPLERGVKGRQRNRRRPKFAGLLLGRAMEPALANKRAAVMARFDSLLAEVERVWERS